MIPKMLVWIMAGCAGGIIAISVAMLDASGWETPGIYTGTSDASHMPVSTTNCYSFQTGCKNTSTQVPQSDLDSGAFLNSNYH